MPNGEGEEQSRVSLEERVNGTANDYNQLCQWTFSLLNVLTNLIGSKPCSPIAKPPKRFNISAAYIQLQYYHFQYGFMVFHDLVKSYVGLSRATASERLFLTQLDFDEILFEAIIKKTKNCSFAIGTLILQQPISKYLQYAHCRIMCEWNMLWFN